jgi:hypothetical protein
LPRACTANGNIASEAAEQRTFESEQIRGYQGAVGEPECSCKMRRATHKGQNIRGLAQRRACLQKRAERRDLAAQRP